MKPRSGILAGGNWIIDHNKIVDVWPSQDALANIKTESLGNGGSPYNILLNLKKLGASFPLEAVGLIGNDEHGKQIMKDCRAHGIRIRGLQTTMKSPTSYTDVMTVASTGRRTFFHLRGANALLDKSHFCFSESRAKLFHLGYLLLLDKLDLPDRTYGTAAGEVLHRAQKAGLKTSVDIVSEESRRFKAVVLPVLRYVHYLFLNEFEAERITGCQIRTRAGLSRSSLIKASRSLIAAGVQEWVIIHYPEGCHAIHKDGTCIQQGSVKVPPSLVISAVGAGDAFASGVLYGVLTQKEMSQCLRYGVCTASACLRDFSTSGGILSLKKCLQWGEKFGFRREPRGLKALGT